MIFSKRHQIIEARIKRNDFEKLAGKFYRDHDSQIIRDLQKSGKSGLLGIQKGTSIYTIIGDEFIYYSTEAGVEREITHSSFLKLLKQNAMKLGKKASFEFLEIEKQNSIWIYNGAMMSAIWNTVQLLEEYK